ncbi:hypothetical protein DACRYDRAFT_104007 [Dacryopinax primogenitus]|uniref:Arrestin C-terminal-like domain-containing protein n=1 Tax=Dacryopinax primogenitus (strain DJM 731) TaxID=1858805 RepID=M5GGI0_DACPD|nr:uncharacterized protein DACRYDRAFT_104007 [Dacryopinax primogenitus]EJU05523.1 hypothetical protein DACRYDRAFT_104007 [Dacryopinax primogenitus]
MLSQSRQSRTGRPRSHSQPQVDCLSQGIGLGISLHDPAPPAELKRRPKHVRGGSTLSTSTGARSIGSAREKDGRGSIIPNADSMTNMLQLASPSSSDLRESTVRPRGSNLERQGTLLLQDPRPGELDVLIGKGGSGKLRRRSQTMPSMPNPCGLPPAISDPTLRPTPIAPDTKGVPLEQAKSRAHVTLDLRLETSTVVEGGSLRGLLEVCVHSPGIWVSGGKLRVVGFEELISPSRREVFYQHTCGLAEAAGKYGGLFEQQEEQEDQEGYRKAREGTHRLAFEMRLPIGGGAKGCVRTKLGQVRYIVIGSLKLKYAHSSTGQPTRSIAHFFRPLSLYPLLPPLQNILAPLRVPLSASISRQVGRGELRVTAELEKGVWVAGGKVWARVEMSNGTGRKVRSLELSIIRCVTAFRPSSGIRKDQMVSDPSDPDTDLDTSCTTATSFGQRSTKVVATSLLDSGEKASGKNRASAKGWWVGVDPGSVESVCFSVTLPEDELSVRRGKLLEVAYKLRVSVCSSPGGVAGMVAGGGEAAVDLPIWVVSFISLDPPPGQRVVSSLPPSLPPSGEPTPELLELGLRASLGMGLAQSLAIDLGALGFASEEKYDADMSQAERERATEQKMMDLMRSHAALSVSESEARRAESVLGSEGVRNACWRSSMMENFQEGGERRMRASVILDGEEGPVTGVTGRAENLPEDMLHSVTRPELDVRGRYEVGHVQLPEEYMVIGDLDWHEQVRLSTINSLHRKQRQHPQATSQGREARTPASTKVSSLSPLQDFPSPPALDARQRASLELARSINAVQSGLPARQDSSSSQDSESGASSSSSRMLERKGSSHSTASSIASLPPRKEATSGLGRVRPLPQVPPGISPIASLASSRLSYSAFSPLAPPPRVTSSPRSFSPPMLRKVAPVSMTQHPRSVSPASSTSSALSVREKVAHFEQAEQVRRETATGGATISLSSTMNSSRSLALSPVLGTPGRAELGRGMSFKAPLFKNVSVAEE